MNEEMKKHLSSLPFLACISEFPENQAALKRSTILSLERLHELFSSYWNAKLEERPDEELSALVDEAVFCRTEMLSQRKLLTALEETVRKPDKPTVSSTKSTPEIAEPEKRSSKKNLSPKPVPKTKPSVKKSPSSTKPPKPPVPIMKRKFTGRTEDNFADVFLKASFKTSRFGAHDSMQSDMAMSDNGWGSTDTGGWGSTDNGGWGNTGTESSVPWQTQNQPASPSNQSSAASKLSWFDGDTQIPTATDSSMQWAGDEEDVEEGWGNQSASWGETDSVATYNNEWADHYGLKIGQQNHVPMEPTTWNTQSSEWDMEEDMSGGWGAPEPPRPIARSSRSGNASADGGQPPVTRTNAIPKGPPPSSSMKSSSAPQPLPPPQMGAPPVRNPGFSEVEWLQNLTFIQNQPACLRVYNSALPHYQQHLIDLSQLTQLVFAAAVEFPTADNQPVTSQLEFLAELEKHGPFTKAVGAAVYKLVTSKNFSLNEAAAICTQANAFETGNLG
ncbi:RITS complex subunit 3 [Schizosaccharomyces japonicus yFS275]|uniref:RITS complex subunit 3 n=1 Tax=Schizosaccharomyces japonicus (strain yFS275 / FY16936) TaxID=402676 RepID=B6K360_SCHJY|nr:RITS complex subunit 3 [Schizosaccharomyces japonicus yFS275]EEB07917.2 RITS complex subunit 3 [Schizosaccharomyces japonicus yFS275]